MEKKVYIPPFIVEINAGKGWVGKSTISAAKALHFALTENKKTLIIDMDGWAALARVIWMDNPQANTIQPLPWVNNLSFAAVQFSDDTLSPIKLRNFKIEESEYEEEYEDLFQNSGNEPVEYKKYIKQFPGDYWLIPYYDMSNEFFTMLNEIEWMYKVLTLVKIMQQAKDQGFDAVVIDVEPTEWLKKVLNSLSKAAQKIRNLAKQGFVQMQIMGAKRPDVKDYLKGEYVKNQEVYTKRFVEVRQMILKANFSIVTLPEPWPLAQVNDVAKILSKMKYKWDRTVYLNKRGELDRDEEEAIITEAKKTIVLPETTTRKDVPYNKQILTGKQTATLKQQKLLELSSVIME